jgi:hypothetical protein
MSLAPAAPGRAGARLVCAVLVVAALICSSTGAARACDPHKIKLTVARPPGGGSTPRYYSIISTCRGASRCSGGQAAVSCGGVTPVMPAGTSTATACTTLAAAITSNPACGPGGANFVVGDVDCANASGGSFTVTAGSCPGGGPGEGILMGVSDLQSLLRPNGSGGIVFGESELDLITPDCSSGMRNVAILGGVATGLPIISGGSSGAVGVLDLRPLGGSTVLAGAATAPGDRPEDVIANLSLELNVGLVGFGDGVTCAPSAAHGRVLDCAGPASGASGLGLGIEPDDTGFVRGVLAGPTGLVEQVVALVDSPVAPLFDQLPAPPPPPCVPAVGGWALAGVGLLLAAAGAVRLSSRRRRPFSA